MIKQFNCVERGYEELIKLLRDIWEERSFVEKKLSSGTSNVPHYVTYSHKTSGPPKHSRTFGQLRHESRADLTPSHKSTDYPM